MVLSRDIDSATYAAIGDRGGFYPIVLVHLDWPGGAIRVHSGTAALSWGGESWAGVGRFGDISLPGETQGLAAQDASLSLLGLGEDLDNYLGDDIRDADGAVYFGAVTEAGGSTLIGEPFEVFVGTIDAMRDVVEAADGGLTRGVRLTLSPGPSQRSSSGVYQSFENQTAAYPGDTAGRLVMQAAAEGQRLRWPA